ncbi:hypothetical protein [Sulfuricaulis sp.]|jgi:hypothetical protein|uniref:hypothetical protein n=1 Tax=Sulfuricaulis sp. TaxID=2003553 RepID=UPI00355A4DF2
MARIGLDPEGKVVSECFALIYAPRRVRDRFPENCVTVVDSEAAALSGADPAKNLYPARVIGPSRSSEGFRLYYLVCWLGAEV